MKNIPVQPRGQLASRDVITLATNAPAIGLLGLLGICDISWFTSFEHLKTLKLLKSNIASIEEINGKCPQLKCAFLWALPNLGDLRPLSSCQELEDLFLRACDAVNSSDLLANLRCPKLRRVDIEWCPGIKSIKFLTSYEKLERLRLSHCPALKSLTGLEHHPFISEVVLQGLPPISDLTPLSHCLNLTELTCAECNLITLEKARDLVARSSASIRLTHKS